MTAYRIEATWSDYYAVFHGDRKVAILFPGRLAIEWPEGVPFSPAQPWTLMPDPEAFPDAACTGLPRPLSPSGNRFDSFVAVEAFLGIEQEKGGGMNLTANDIAVLRAMESRGPDFGFMSFGTIAADSGVDRKAIRRIVRRLARAGLTEFSCGLWSEDGRPAGAGYAITHAGRCEIGPDVSFYSGAGEAA